MNVAKCDCMSSWGSYAHVFLRVVTGIIFAAHGWQKVQAPDGMIAGFFTSVGIPAANFFAPLVTYVELIGGVMLIVGALTHWVSKLNIVIMLVAMFAVHWSKGFYANNGGYEYALLLLAVSVYLACAGSGKLALDSMWCKKDGEQM